MADSAGSLFEARILVVSRPGIGCFDLSLVGNARSLMVFAFAGLDTSMAFRRLGLASSRSHCPWSGARWRRWSAGRRRSGSSVFLSVCSSGSLAQAGYYLVNLIAPR